MLTLVLLPCLFLVQNPDPREQGNNALTVARQGPGTAEGRAAWQRLTRCGPEILPLLLQLMDTGDVVRANWLRTAFDRIVERHLKDKQVPVEPLLTFAQEPKHAGRARRLALEVVEKIRPGTTARLLAGWLEDPEFRFDAVEQLLDQAKKANDPSAKQDLYRRAFTASRTLEQARAAQAGLQKLGVQVSAARHLGFLMDWYLIGPFDSRGNKGFQLRYPPEEKVDLQAEHEGQSGKVKWIRYQVQEPAATINAKHIALVNLRETRALGDADDAVAFAYTEIVVKKPQRVEFRGAADDNFTVYVNGKKVFAFEEYRNGIRFDRHRFAVDLQAGRNTVLVKVCQTPPPNPEPNWEFILRVVDAQGRGLEMENGLR